MPSRTGRSPEAATGRGRSKRLADAPPGALTLGPDEAEGIAIDDGRSSGWRSITGAIGLALLLLGGPPAWSQAGRSTGLPVPRFVSLGADRVNVRFGPGKQYPINWVFARKDLPVEIVAEFDTWRKIRDFDGEEGWIHSSLLSSRRTIMVTGAGALSCGARRAPIRASCCAPSRA